MCVIKKHFFIVQFHPAGGRMMKLSDFWVKGPFIQLEGSRDDKKERRLGWTSKTVWYCNGGSRNNTKMQDGHDVLRILYQKFGRTFTSLDKVIPEELTKRRKSQSEIQQRNPFSSKICNLALPPAKAPLLLDHRPIATLPKIWVHVKL